MENFLFYVVYTFNVGIQLDPWSPSFSSITSVPVPASALLTVCAAVNVNATYLPKVIT